MNLAELHDRSFARATSATATAYPPERRLTGEQLANYLDQRSYALVAEGPAETVSLEETPEHVRATEDGEWVSEWIRMCPERVLSYAAAATPGNTPAGRNMD